MIGSCKLCLRSEVTLRNSHIVPEFCYLACYDEKHRFHALSTTGPKHDRFAQKGIREYMLCQECETHLSRFEGYAKASVFEGGLTRRGQNEFMIELGGVDYTRFRIYLLSLLWRMSVSGLEIFAEVNLGPDEETLRQHVLYGDAPPPEQYPCLLTAVRIDGKFRSDYIIQPSVTQDRGQRVYRIPIGGIIYSFFIGSHPVEGSIQQLTLNREGVLPVLIAPLEKIPFMVAHFEQLSKKHENA